MDENSLCIEIGENLVRIADAKSDNQQIEINSLGQQIDTPRFFSADSDRVIEDEVKIIETLVSRLNIKKKNVNIIVPDAYTYSQVLVMPVLKEKELLAAIKYQADQFIPLPIEETAIDLDIIYEDKINKKILILIVAAPYKLIDKVEKTIEMAGCIPESIENEASAVIRFLSNHYKNLSKKTTDGTLFLNFGETASSLYFFDHTYNLVTAVHNFKIGLNLFLKEIQVNFNYDLNKTRDILTHIGLGQEGSYNFEEVLKPVMTELISEINKFILSIKAKQNDINITQIVLFNLANKIHFLEKKVQDNFSINSSIIDVSSLIKKNQIIEPHKNELSSFITAIAGSLS